MIIWSRWGFLTALGIGAGALLAWPLTQVLPFLPQRGLGVPGMIFAFGAVVNFALARWAYPRLDKPYVVTERRYLAEPVHDSEGRIAKTFEDVVITDAEGNPIIRRPISTLFFIPARWIWIMCILAAIGFGIAAVVNPAG